MTEPFDAGGGGDFVVRALLISGVFSLDALVYTSCRTDEVLKRFDQEPLEDKEEEDGAVTCPNGDGVVGEDGIRMSRGEIEGDVRGRLRRRRKLK